MIALGVRRVGVRGFVFSVLVVMLTLVGTAQALAATGDFLGKWGTQGVAAGQFDRPYAVAVAANGDVYVADKNNHRIQYFSSAGSYKGEWGSLGNGDGEFSEPHGIGVAPNGDVYVADTFNNRIQFFSAAGDFKGKWGATGVEDGKFSWPTAVAIAPGGTVYVADSHNHRVQYFGPTGIFKGKWGSSGSADGEFRYAWTVALAPNGDVYVGELENKRIQYFSPTGAFKGKWGKPGSGEGEFDYPASLAISPDGDIYVADYLNSRVQRFGLTGTFRGAWGSGGSGESQFDYPAGIALGPDGSVYVADAGNHRIQRFEGAPRSVTRLSDRTRFSTAIAIAKAGFPEWAGVKHVVIASGDDRAAADPLAASGLCWAYDAPMLLVSAARTPDEAKAALSQIVAKNASVTLHIVGGPISVPDARVAELVAAGGGSAKVATDRILSTGGRYDLAAAIALRMKAVAAINPAKTMPKTALFANGADATKFFDALALSPISAGTGAPILLVTATSVPPATTSAIAALAPTTKIVGGGPNTVSDAVRAQLGATRWSGRTRYDTAIAIANGAVSKGWLNRGSVGIAAKLPDALTGGSLVGSKRGVLLLSDGTTLTPATGGWLGSYKAQIARVWVFGGPLSISEGVKTAIGNALK